MFAVDLGLRAVAAFDAPPLRLIDQPQEAGVVEMCAQA
jgi:hypothetical protein